MLNPAWGPNVVCGPWPDVNALTVLWGRVTSELQAAQTLISTDGWVKGKWGAIGVGWCGLGALRQVRGSL